MQNGHRWVVREKTTGKWLRRVSLEKGAELTDELADAMRFATRFRAEDDASFLSTQARRKDDSWMGIRGMVFEVYEFDDSDRSRQVLPYLVFTPNTRKVRP